MSRMTKMVIAAVLIVVLVGGAAAAVWYFTWKDSRKEAFKKTLASDWNAIAKKSPSVAVAAGKVSSSADLRAVGDAVRQLRDPVNTAITRASLRWDGSDKETVAREMTALRSLDAYLGTLEKLSGGDGTTFMISSSELDQSAIKARMDISSFLSYAPYINTSPPSSLFQAPNAIEQAFESGGERKADVSAALLAADTFMAADVKKFNIDTIWALLSSSSHYALDAFKITKDILATNWNQSRNNKVATGYEIDPHAVFTGQDSLKLQAVMYFKEDKPQAGELMLVKEGGQWKLAGYGFNNIP